MKRRELLRDAALLSLVLPFGLLLKWALDTQRLDDLLLASLLVLPLAALGVSLAKWSATQMDEF